MIKLGESVRLVMFQFSFSNLSLVPKFVRELESETEKESTKRKNQTGGEMVIEPTEKSDLASCLNQLEQAGYEMVNVSCQERLNQKKGKRNYCMVRFIFARSEYAQPSEDFLKIRDHVRIEMKRICKQAMWRVRAYSNPFYENGEELPEFRALSINLEAREPYKKPDGDPVTVWLTDDYGNRIGPAPIPISPEHQLNIEEEGDILLKRLAG